jgi:hypothetical protein
LRAQSCKFLVDRFAVVFDVGCTDVSPGCQDVIVGCDFFDGC